MLNIQYLKILITMQGQLRQLRQLRQCKYQS
jgi:hypothetical protein